ncbi:MAG: hypothetical protein ACE1ZC_04045 [Nitrososphaerales archaeon]
MPSKGEVRLGEIDRRLGSLISHSRGVVSQLKELNQKSKDLRVELRDISSKIAEERQDLQVLFVESRSLRDSRSQLIEKIRTSREAIRNVEKSVMGFEDVSSGENEEILSRQLEAIEWKLQAERLSRDEERGLVDHIKILETRLHNWRKAYSKRQHLSDLVGDSREIRAKIDELDDRRAFVREKIGPNKESVKGRVAARTQLFDELDENREDVKELVTSMHRAGDEISQLREERGALHESLRLRNASSFASRRMSLLNEKKGEAKKKLQEGKSLSLDELKLAFDQEDELVR